ncbi:MAG: hypothetical protein AAGB51_10295 [Planctomycetota bacterium]
MKTVCTIIVLGGMCASASAQVVDPSATGAPAAGLLTNFGTTEAISVSGSGGVGVGSIITGSDSYVLGGGWVDFIAGTGARWSAATDPHIGTFDPGGATEVYGGAPTQIGVDFNVIEFSSISGTTGNSIAQVTVFSADGGSMDAAFAGLPGFGFTVGDGFFVGDPRDTLEVDAPGFNVVSVDFGFFNDGTFLGSGSATDLSGPDGLAGTFAIDVVAAGLVFDEAFILFEYEVIPAPGAAALLGMGLLAARRRRS